MITSKEIASSIDRLRLYLQYCVGVLLVIQLVCGLLLSLRYQPQDSPKYSQRQLPLIPFQAKCDVVDPDGDTLTFGGETTLLEFNSSHSRVEFPNGDSSAFRPIVQSDTNASAASAAWLSVFYSIETKGVSGWLIRAIHQRATDILFIILFTNVLLMLFANRDKAAFVWDWYAGILLIGFLIVQAWSGSVLPWSIKSAMGLRIVTSSLSEYLPILGTAFKEFVIPSDSSVTALHRSYILHVMIIPVGIFLLMSWWKGRSVEQEKLSALRVVLSMTLFIVVLALVTGHQSLSTQDFPFSASAQVLADVKPAWYFQGINLMMKSQPTDFVALLLGSSALYFLLFPVLKRRIRMQKLVTVLGVAFLSYQLVFMLFAL